MGTIAIPASSSGGGGMNVLKDLTGIVTDGTQNSTKTFVCNVGDLILSILTKPSSITGATLLADGSTGQYGGVLMAYKATSTSVTVAGTGNVGHIIVFENSKNMANHVASVDRSQLTNTNANLTAKKGDLIFLTYAASAQVPQKTNPEDIQFRHLLPLGVYGNVPMFMVTEDNNARYYTPGNNYGLTILHFNY